ncbi:hypothetical protein HOD05_01085 [Candidatus Woesearchaeota archaeon]|jgi:TolA-binding protein|nr:hypothetical protein [Candidatus Woesearchaeota archaeon]MBT4151001.1 hypothetical protein [Candidatus Woesearchaeota archaeon]MBT4247230.1 hypothetical protein [Candidatus Woesearchaeota archaeon]MBT4433791.1 hypothetical protein [Candidatus Woesearchaeota archaeon]MBT7332210.1 hypothetical protein [Candidatus Woesearchaeota archaeon]
MVNKKFVVLFVLVMMLVLSLSVSAENLTKSSKNVTVKTNVTIDPNTQKITFLQLKINSLEKQISKLNIDLTTLENKVTRVGQDVQIINSQQSTLEKDVKKDVGSVATGLAGLQKNLDTTKDNLTEVAQDLEGTQSFNTFLAFIIFLIVVGIIGIIFYAKKKGFGRKVHPHVANYITNHIKQGKKFEHIKQNLVKAGWNEKDVHHAYKHTMKKNYQSYKKTQGPDKKKIVIISLIGIVIIIIGIFSLSSSVGQAVKIQQNVNTETKVLTTDIICEDGLILNPTGDGCCKDVDTNSVCDDVDAYQKNKAIEDKAVCADNNDCSSDKVCINNKCGYVKDIYQGSSVCSQKCTYYSVETITSDEETYFHKPGQGGYTAAGGLTWDLLDAPSHCIEENALAVFEISKFGPTTSIDDEGNKITKIDIIGKEIVALEQGKKSKIITHPANSNIKFTLLADEIFENCN